MKIDRRLNLVLKTESVDGTPLHIHSVPVSRAIWEGSFRLMSKAIVTMYGDGLTPGAAARVAMLYLKDTAKEMDGPTTANTPNPGVFSRQAAALLAEVWRLTNVAMIDKSGLWQAVPFQEVLDKRLLDEDVSAEVQNTLVFFTLASWFHREEERRDLNTLMNAYGARTVASDFTEFMSSLQISTPEGSSGETATQSSIRH